MAAGYQVCDDGVGNRITQLPFGIEKLVGRLGDRTQSAPSVLAAPDRCSTGCEAPYVRANAACPLDIVPITRNASGKSVATGPVCHWPSLDETKPALGPKSPAHCRMTPESAIAKPGPLTVHWHTRRMSGNHQVVGDRWTLLAADFKLGQLPATLDTGLVLAFVNSLLGIA